MTRRRESLKRARLKAALCLAALAVFLPACSGGREPARAPTPSPELAALLPGPAALSTQFAQVALEGAGLMPGRLGLGPAAVQYGVAYRAELPASVVVVALVGSMANAAEQEQFDKYVDNFDSKHLPGLAKQVIAFAAGLGQGREVDEGDVDVAGCGALADLRAGCNSAALRASVRIGDSALFCDYIVFHRLLIVGGVCAVYSSQERPQSVETFIRAFDAAVQAYTES